MKSYFCYSIDIPTGHRHRHRHRPRHRHHKLTTCSNSVFCRQLRQHFLKHTLRRRRHVLVRDIVDDYNDDVVDDGDGEDDIDDGGGGDGEAHMFILSKTS